MQAGIPPETAEKFARLRELLEGYRNCLVAFSGGVDSTVLAHAAYDILGDQAVAATATSPSMPRNELEETVKLAHQIGIRHELVETDELEDPHYQVNDPRRCYFCKRIILRSLGELANRLELRNLLDGSNADDQDDYRPGSQAVLECQVKTPLAEVGLTKDEIRLLAREWGLPNWNKPATPCLSSRLAYGVSITAERLKRIERAEEFLRKLGFSPLRVRYHQGEIARIEILPEQIPQILDSAKRSQIVERLKQLGFEYITLDLEGFRSGSLNAVLSEKRRDESE